MPFASWAYQLFFGIPMIILNQIYIILLGIPIIFLVYP